MTKNRIIILTPTYFDIESFILLHGKIINSDLFLKYEIIFFLVDDSAGLDVSVRKIFQFNNVKIITPPYNLGHQSAIMFGLSKIYSIVTGNDLIVTIDSDLEDNPEDISRLVDSFEKNSVQTENLVILAQRIKRQESIQFKVMYYCFRLFFGMLIGQNIKTGNFACFNKVVLDTILKHPYFQLCYSSTFLALKFNIVNVPCIRNKRPFGKSKMNLTALIGHGIRMCLPFFNTVTTRIFIFLCFNSFFTFLFLVIFRLKSDIILLFFSIIELTLILLLLIFIASYLSISGKNINEKLI